MAIGVSKKIISKTTSAYSCPKCGNKHSMSISVIGSCLKILFIPFITLGKSAVVTCNFCSNTYSESHMPSKLKTEVNKEKRYHQVPVWHFTWVIFLVGFYPMLIATYRDINYYNYNLYDYSGYDDDTYYEDESSETSPVVNSYIAYPEIGDVYEYTISRGNYSTMKVVNIGYDSIYVKKNNIITESMTYVDDINVEENYSDSIIAISNEALKALHSSYVIYNIERPE